MNSILKNTQYYKFCMYGFLKNLRFFDAFFILFLLEKGLSYTQIGILYALREIVINLAEIPSGIIADTYGRKKALVFSFILYISSFVIFYLATDFWFFTIAFILYGFADAFRSGTHKGMIMDYLRMQNSYDSKINYYGHTRACSQRGSAIASLIAGSIVFYYGNYQNIFLFSMIPYIINLFLILSYPKELNISLVKKGQTNNKTLGKTIHDLWYTIKQPEVFSIVNSAALFTAYQKAIKDYIQPLMLQVILILPLLTSYDAQKKSGIWIGIMYFVIYLLNAYASKSAGKIREGKTLNFTKKIMFYGFLFGAVSGLFFLNKYYVIALIVFIGVYLVENIRKPILTGLLADVVPNKILTSALSVQSQWRTLITALLSIALGFLSDMFGVGIAFICLSLFLLIFSYLVTIKRVD